MTEISSKKSNWKHKYRSLRRQEGRQEFEEWSEDDFINYILELRAELEELQQKMEQQSTAEANMEKQREELAEKDFKQDWPYSTKFVFLLTLEKTPLTSRKIHKQLLELDKQYKFYNNPKGTLSVYLRAVVKSGRIKAIKIPGYKEKLFALPEWVNKEGALKPAYEHKPQFQ